MESEERSGEEEGGGVCLFIPVLPCSCLITCTDEGALCFWPPEREKVKPAELYPATTCTSCGFLTHSIPIPPPVLYPTLSPSSLSLFLPPQWVVDVGPRVCAMATNPREDLQVATGGRENPLKLWDGHHTEKPLFIAKNVSSSPLWLDALLWGWVSLIMGCCTCAIVQVRPDKLDLRVPVWVNEVGFAPDSGPHPVLVVGTGHGHVRLYDTAAQRRPVYSTQHGTEPITALDITPDGRYAPPTLGSCDSHVTLCSL